MKHPGTATVQSVNWHKHFGEQSGNSVLEYAHRLSLAASLMGLCSRENLTVTPEETYTEMLLVLEEKRYNLITLW